LIFPAVQISYLSFFQLFNEVKYINDMLSENPNLPYEIAIKLINNRKLNVQITENIAKNITNTSILDLLSTRDNERSVRVLVAQNKNTLPDTLFKMTADDNSVVSAQAILNNNFPVEKINSEDIYFENPETLLHVGRKLTSPEMIRTLYKKYPRSSAFRSGLAHNENVPIDIVKLL